MCKYILVSFKYVIEFNLAFEESLTKYTCGAGSTPSDRPVLIVHSSGVVICWDKALPSLLAYQPPINSGAYVRSDDLTESYSSTYLVVIYL